MWPISRPSMCQKAANIATPAARLKNNSTARKIALSAWERFYALALVGWLRPMITVCTNLRKLATEPQFAMLDADSLAPPKMDTI